jgi:adenosyl cobinamide kinase/adenosyl cobinamide phosphate guanylyltransferase
MRHAVTRRHGFGPRLHEVAERIRGHEPQRHQLAWEEKHDPREVAAFLAAFREKEGRK